MDNLPKYNSDNDYLNCANCDARPVLVTERQGSNDDGQPYWSGYMRCNRPACGMRTPRKSSPYEVIKIWNREPEE